MKKRGIALNELGGWIIAAAVFLLVMAGYIYLKLRGISAIQFLKNIIGMG